MTDEEVRRLSWRCRRGLLELDIVLQRFAAHYLADLTQNELVALDGLLDLRLPISKVMAMQARDLDGQALHSVLAKLTAREQNEG
jgi:antitoxin CptB